SGAEPERALQVFYLDSKNVELTRSTLMERWNQLPTADPIKGIRQYHHFDSRQIGEIEASYTSCSTDSKLYQMLTKGDKKTAKRVHSVIGLLKNDYIVAEVLDKWSLALITGVDIIRASIDLQFFHPAGPSLSFSSPKPNQAPNQSTIFPNEIIARLVEHPKATRRGIVISAQQLASIEDIYSEF
ncbi:unnamed protein product, partial [Didymodactylos carnosus]